MKTSFKSVFIENSSYKLVALFISLILWFSILGRRDFQVTKSFEIDLNIAVGNYVDYQSADHVKVRVAGPRTALQKFLQGSSNQIINLDLTQYKAGDYKVTIPTHKLDLPFGIKVISVKPPEVQVRLKNSL